MATTEYAIAVMWHQRCCEWKRSSIQSLKCGDNNGATEDNVEALKATNPWILAMDGGGGSPSWLALTPWPRTSKVPHPFQATRTSTMNHLWQTQSILLTKIPKGCYMDKKFVAFWLLAAKKNIIPEVWLIKLGTNLTYKEILSLENGGFRMPLQKEMTTTRLFQDHPLPVNLANYTTPTYPDEFPSRRLGKLIQRNEKTPSTKHANNCASALSLKGRVRPQIIHFHCKSIFGRILLLLYLNILRFVLCNLKLSF